MKTPEFAPPGTPAAPTGLAAMEISRDRVVLVWDDPGDSSITGYQVLRRFIDGDEYGDRKGSREFVPVAEDTGTPTTTYTDTSVAAATRYVYRVKARNEAGLSRQSGYENVWTPEDEPPEAPTGLAAAEVSHDRVALVWDDP